jgi:hypothetical protein
MIWGAEGFCCSRHALQVGQLRGLVPAKAVVAGCTTATQVVFVVRCCTECEVLYNCQYLPDMPAQVCWTEHVLQKDQF